MLHFLRKIAYFFRASWFVIKRTCGMQEEINKDTGEIIEVYSGIKDFVITFCIFTCIGLLVYGAEFSIGSLIFALGSIFIIAHIDWGFDALKKVLTKERIF